MLTIAAFASLAQLGSGLALALAIFLEPITFRERRYRHKLEGALHLIPKDGSDQAKSRENEVWTKIIELDEVVKRAHELSRWPLWVIKAGAAINFIVLLLATIAPDGEVSWAWMWVLLLMCILPVLIGSLWLSGIAKAKIGKIERSFST